ncbi:stage III sporulation protein AF [Alkalihalobacterium chitinilyticum]|uniref:Stage III sporulation protein AF n=1 Tax=Alkalihalobacterium chitinilyticum TaxID=2980103 RepID=A0ABT5V9W3_9BACI|nr:stage III sporulation protein AF [Alkalihalobacterium chitinilyticum]MDE5412252.1 stage III sporulation protein AF [Alkalihalobacterium chitinilyticum]
MSFLTDWLTNIIIFILLATILELLLPNSSMQRYVKMVVGLLLLVIILNPLLSIFSKDINDILPNFSNNEHISEKSLENSIEKKKIEIERGQRAYISEQMAVPMKRQVEEELVAKFDVEVDSVQITLDEFAFDTTDEDAIVKVTVHLKRVAEEENEGELVQAVSVVNIDTRKELPSEEETALDTVPIQTFLADEWQIPKDKISLAWEGGEQ